MPKILFLTLHRPDRSPSQRFRFEQYLDYLEENGFHYDFSYLISPEDDKIFYKSGNLLGKFNILRRSVIKRFKEVKQVDDYDLVFVQREGFMLGTTFFENKFAKKTKLIFDFDDAIWIHSVSESNKLFGWLKNPNKTKELIRMADKVIAGNDYLADYAREYNENVFIIPTTIDTDEYKREERSREKKKGVCIGWSGSITTIEHFRPIESVLQKIKEKFGDQVYFKVIGDGSYQNEKLEIQGVSWQKHNELEELSEIDIGLMPLPDDKWANGKCGLKGLQYMALSIATIMSPVGVNSDIIDDGVNGLLAKTEEDWFTTMSLLIDNKDLREEMGRKGRSTVIKSYSVDSQKKNYLKLFTDLLR